MAAPGTPNAVSIPSFSSTRTAASTALILGMTVSFLYVSVFGDTA
jgi:hypothetical protein